MSLQHAHPHRPRSVYFGELIQMDASPYRYVHDQIWHLHIAVDDCTGTLVGAYFDTQETLNGYYNVLSRILRDYGIPYSILTDNRTVFTYKRKNSTSPDENAHTQFAYACSQLGIDIQTTSVPQAKGRVERYNATLQSRLPIELKLAGITTIGAANEFLKSHVKELNTKFALPHDSTKSVFEKQPPADKISMILSVLSQRIVDNGNCIHFNKKYYQIMDEAGNRVLYSKGTKALVVETFDGDMFCTVDDKVHILEELPEHYAKSKNFDSDYVTQTPRTRYIPPMCHPWKHDSFVAFQKKRDSKANTA